MSTDFHVCVWDIASCSLCTKTVPYSVPKPANPVEKHTHTCVSLPFCVFKYLLSYSLTIVQSNIIEYFRYRYLTFANQTLCDANLNKIKTQNLQ